MKLTRWFAIVLIAVAGCTSTTPEMAVINGAADALGGSESILAVNTLVLEGTGENGNFGQNLSPDAVLPTFNVSVYKRTIDLANNRGRLEQTRTPTYVTGNTAPQIQNLGVDGDVAFNVPPPTPENANPPATRQTELLAKERRAEMYHHPITAVRAALAEGAQVTNARKDGNDDVVDITTASGDKLTLYVDSTTKLPSKVVTMTYQAPNTVFGDIAVETTFSSYTPVDGLQMPGQLTTRMDKYTTADIRLSNSTINADAAGIAAPEDVKAVPAPPLFAEAVITVEPVSPTVTYLTGQSHHSVLVEFADHLVLVESPQNEVRAAAVLAKVKELKPDKPLRYVINTHHHIDHAGGVRRAIAEGVTLITHESSKAFFEAIAARPHTLMPDELSKNPKPATVEGVTEKRVLQDATRTLEIYPMTGNPHADTLLMVYLPAERMLIQADIYNPPNPGAAPAPSYPFAPNMVEAVQQLGLRVDRLLPIHGRIVPYADAVRVTRGS